MTSISCVSKHELKEKILIAKQKYFIHKINIRFDTFRSIIHKFDVHTTRFKSNSYFELVRAKKNYFQHFLIILFLLFSQGIYIHL